MASISSQSDCSIFTSMLMISSVLNSLSSYSMLTPPPPSAPVSLSGNSPAVRQKRTAMAMSTAVNFVICLPAIMTSASR